VFGKPPRKQTKVSARLVLEVSAGWATPTSRGMWGGDALLLSILENEMEPYSVEAT
jgi:hypothetical protein